MGNMKAFKKTIPYYGTMAGKDNPTIQLLYMYTQQTKESLLVSPFFHYSLIDLVDTFVCCDHLPAPDSIINFYFSIIFEFEVGKWP